MAKIFGRATIVAGSMALDSNKGASLDTGGVKRTSKMTSRGRAGAMEEQSPAVVECSIPKTAGIKVADLKALSDVTVKFKDDVGKLYSVAHADLMEPPKFDDQNGDIALKFEGDEAQEIG
jgi:hypothetical protein